MLMTLTMPAGPETCEEPRAATPPVRVKVRSADELRKAMRQARQASLALDASGLDRVLRVDAARGLTEVQAGTSWSLLAAYLAQRQMKLDSFAAMAGTVGEAVSQAAPGPDGLPVTAHVAGLTLVMPDGELRRIARDARPELFQLALGGQGIIGVLYSATLDMKSLEASAREARAPVDLCIADAAAAGTVPCEIECLLPPDELPAFLAGVRAAAHEHRIALHAISVRRYAPESESLLRWATRDWAGVRVRFGIKATLGAGVRAAEIRRLLLELALAHRGSFPLREAHHATRSQIEACYPMLPRFFAEKRRLDPEDRLQNAWYRDVLEKMRLERCEVRWARSEAER